MELYDLLDHVHSNKILFLSVLLVIIFIASNIDFAFGWVNARFNINVEFVSGIALYGIIKKMMYFIVLAFFMPVAFILIPENIAVSSLTLLYVGYLVSELNSIASHLGFIDDGKKGELFRTFISRLVKGDV